MKKGYTMRLHVQKIILSGLLILFSSIINILSAQREINIPSSVVTIKKISGDVRTPQSGGDPNAFYSNVTHSLNAVYANGLAATDTANPTAIITALVADNLTLAGTPPYTLGAFTFSVSNSSNTVVSARPRIRFYLANGPNGGPGTVFGAYSFSAVDFAANSAQTLSTSITPIQITSSTIWAGITFDNQGATPGTTTGATATQLNALGQQLFNPVDKGSSTDLYFKTNSNGSFNANNPTGATANFGGNPFANFAWELSPTSPLPIVIEYIHGVNKGSSNVIEWKVDCINSLHAFMTLQKSLNNLNFKDIYSINATSDECLKAFKYIDLDPSGGVCYYRLKMKDDAGIEKFSDIILVLNKNKSFELTSIYPNPVQSNSITTLQIASAQKDKLTIQIFDISGKVMMDEIKETVPGKNKLILNLNRLLSGTYRIKVTDDQGSSQMLTFIKH